VRHHPIHEPDRVEGPPILEEYRVEGLLAVRRLVAGQEDADVADRPVRIRRADLDEQSAAVGLEDDAAGRADVARSRSISAFPSWPSSIALVYQNQQT
jgi:hypothetical protein